ncbi:hypothetical protein ECDEC14A_3571 [Escherichia coli DEC14A]|nr:hypothetical protein ECDEC14A_3571 [Escherichia coli DEC14A]
MVFVLPVCQTVAKSNFPIFTLIQNLTIKNPPKRVFRKLFSAGAEAN